MKRNEKIGIIGLGNMGYSLGFALRKVSRGKIYVYDKDQRKISGAGDFCIGKNSQEVIENVGVLVLAIKPQDVRGFLRQTKSALLNHRPLLISIAAGIPTTFFEEYLKGLKVIRVMPNLGAKVGESVSFVCKGRYTQEKDLKIAKRIFSSIGEVIEIKEALLDKVTSISGSGPGYIYYFMDCIYQSARQLGFKEKQARDMVMQTFWGAIKLAKLCGKDFKLLAKEVASRGGTTEAALKVFKRKRLFQVVYQGIDAAHKRAKQLSGLYKNKSK